VEGKMKDEGKVIRVYLFKWEIARDRDALPQKKNQECSKSRNKNDV
jgi:hypothetical protein